MVWIWQLTGNGFKASIINMFKELVENIHTMNDQIRKRYQLRNRNLKNMRTADGYLALVVWGIGTVSDWVVSEKRRF